MFDYIYYFLWFVVLLAIAFEIYGLYILYSNNKEDIRIFTYLASLSIFWLVLSLFIGLFQILTFTLLHYQQTNEFELNILEVALAVFIPIVLALAVDYFFKIKELSLSKKIKAMIFLGIPIILFVFYIITLAESSKSNNNSLEIIQCGILFVAIIYSVVIRYYMSYCIDEPTDLNAPIKLNNPKPDSYDMDLLLDCIRKYCQSLKDLN